MPGGRSSTISCWRGGSCLYLKHASTEVKNTIIGMKYLNIVAVLRDALAFVKNVQDMVFTTYVKNNFFYS